MKQLIINELSKKYGDNVLFNHLSIKISSKNIYFLTAENGKGKTTFFKSLLKETEYQGDIIDEGMTYVYLPEKPLMPEYIKVQTFLVMFYLFDHPDIDQDLIDSMLDSFGVLKYKNTMIKNLSKGTKQKIMLIKTLLQKGDIYLFDEPLSGLDDESRKKFMYFVDMLNIKDNIVIISTHYYDDYYFDNKEIIYLS